MERRPFCGLVFLASTEWEGERAASASLRSVGVVMEAPLSLQALAPLSLQELAPVLDDLLLKDRKLRFDHRMRDRIKGICPELDKLLFNEGDPVHLGSDPERLERIGKLMTEVRGWYECLEDLLDDYLLRVDDGRRYPWTHMNARRHLLTTVDEQIRPQLCNLNGALLDDTGRGTKLPFPGIYDIQPPAFPAHLKELSTLLMSHIGDDNPLKERVRKFLLLLDRPEADSDPPPVTLLTGVTGGSMSSNAGLCFLYLSACRDSFAIPAKWLVLLWEAEGLDADANSKLHPRRGEGYLDELVKRNMIQAVRRGVSGRVRTCRIHPLLHSYCTSAARKAGFLQRYRLDTTRDDDDHTKISNTTTTTSTRVNNNNQNSSSSSAAAHRLVISYLRPPRTFHDYPNLRSLFCYHPIGPYWFDHRTLKFLRLLHLEGPSVSSLQDDLDKFRLLRHLSFRDTSLTSLPPSTGRLCFLQHLDLRGNPIKELPSSLRKLKSLRYLDLRGTLVKYIPYFVSGLHDLEWLYMDIEATKNGSHHDFSALTRLHTFTITPVGLWMDSLGKLDLLNKLGLYGDYTLGKMLPSTIRELTNLRSLKLGFGFGDTEPPLMSILPSLTNLSTLYLHRRLDQLPRCDNLPPRLRKLCLRWSLLREDPLETLCKLPELQVLRLERGSYLGDRLVCLFGGFEKLQALKLEYLNDMEEWVIQEGSMPKLERLSIRCCRSLHALPDGLMNVSTLKELKLLYMTEEFYSSLRNSKFEPRLKDIGCETVVKKENTEGEAENERHQEVSHATANPRS